MAMTLFETIKDAAKDIDFTGFLKYNVQLDACTLCNLDCYACGQRIDEKLENSSQTIGRGWLSLANFKKFIELNKNKISYIELSNSGEPLLNPELPEILKYAYEHNVPVGCYGGTNFNIVSDELIKAMVDYQMTGIAVSLDGSSQEAYSKYRRKGDFNKVIDNIKKLNKYKKEKNSEFPKLTWKYIIMASTEDEEEILRAKQMAEELGMTIIFHNTWEYDFHPKNPARIYELTGLTYANRTEERPDFDKTVELTKEEIEQHGEKFGSNNKQERQFCAVSKDNWSYTVLPDEAEVYQCIVDDCLAFFLRKKIVINWDGRLYGCCTNKMEAFNFNAFEKPLDQFYKSEEFKNYTNFIFNKDSLTVCEADYSGCLKCYKGKIIQKHRLFNYINIDAYNYILDEVISNT